MFYHSLYSYLVSSSFIGESYLLRSQAIIVSAVSTISSICDGFLFISPLLGVGVLLVALFELGDLLVIAGFFPWAALVAGGVDLLGTALRLCPSALFRGFE